MFTQGDRVKWVNGVGAILSGTVLETPQYHGQRANVREDRLGTVLRPRDPWPEDGPCGRTCRTVVPDFSFCRCSGWAPNWPYGSTAQPQESH